MSPSLEARTYGRTMAFADRPETLGQLRQSGYEPRSVKQEIRDNLLGRLRAGETAFPGIVGFDDTVLPELESALLAGHDLVLLGERGQGKTRLMRTLGQLLDEWSPVVEGCEINDDPLRPVCGALPTSLLPSWATTCRCTGGTATSATPRSSRLRTPASATSWATSTRSRWQRDAPWATPRPCTTGSCRAPTAASSASTSCPTWPSASRSRCSTCWRSATSRSAATPCDCRSTCCWWPRANPEDYTNRGRIITPLKDRFGAEIRTHYPVEVAEEVALIAQEAELVAEVPEHLLEVLARLARGLRESSSVDQRSGVSARFAIAAAEGVAASALRRLARAGDPQPVARVCDVRTVLPTLLGKVEFEMGEEGREREVLATCCASRSPRPSARGFPGWTCPASPSCSPRAPSSRPASSSLLTSCSASSGPIPGLSKVLDRLGAR